MRGIFFDTVTWFKLIVVVMPKQSRMTYRSLVSVRVLEAWQVALSCTRQSLRQFLHPLMQLS